MAGSASTIPGPKGKWLIGDAMAFDQDPIGWLERTHREYGDVVRLDPSTVVVHHPDTVHQVLSWTNGPVILDNALLAGRAAERDLLARLPDWMTVRRDTLRGVHRNLISAHLTRIGTVLRSDLAALAGHRIDVFDATQRLCGRAVADFCLGGEADVDEIVGAVEDVFWASLTLAAKHEGRTRLARKPALKRAIACNDTLVTRLTAAVVRRRATRRPETPRDLLDVLLGQPDPAPDAHLAAVLRITLLASHGIPGAALAWTLLRLHEHPHVAAAVQAEAGALADASTEPTARSGWLPTDDLPYTTAMVKEVLRLHPPTWLMARKVIEPITVDRYRLAAGTRVLFAPYILHQDPRWWTQPQNFQPERWLGDQPATHPHAYLPFGSGPRYCVGSHLGTVQLVLLAAELASHYRLRLPPLADVAVECKSLLLPAGLHGSWHPNYGLS